MSEVKRYYAEAVSEHALGAFVSSKDYAALAAQRDEGLAREAELKEQRNRSARLAIAKSQLAKQRFVEIEVLQQRLAEAKELLRDLYDQNDLSLGDDQRILRMLANPGCADGDKSE